MNDLIRKLKRLVSELESYDYCNNSNKVNQIADEIVTTATIIKKSTHKIDFSPGLEKISIIPFIYKPITVRNYYEGDYLERFSSQRTNDLKNANVLELHNKFWTSNNVERGNIFGSLPTELIPKDSVTKLLNMGWELADATVYEVDKTMSLSEVFEICNNNFPYYIITSEKKDNYLIVLQFNII